MEATIRDVARDAGVSVATVSRVLNHPDKVRPGLRERVQTSIKELGFRPSRVAQGLKNRQFKSVALAVNDVSNAFFGEMTKAIQHGCFERGYEVILFNLDSDRDRLLQFLSDVPAYSVDGIILCTSMHLDDPEVVLRLHALKDAGRPIILAGYPVSGGGFATIMSDQVQGIRKVVDHLTTEGCETLAFIGNSAQSLIGAGRLVAFKGAVAEHGLKLKDDSTRFTGGDYHAGYQNALELLALREPPDGIVCSGDQLAVGALRAARELGFHVPGDVAIVGFDDTPICEFLTPTLTSVRLDPSALGTATAEALLDAIRADIPVPESASRIFPCTIAIRQSSRRRTFASAGDPSAGSA